MYDRLLACSTKMNLATIEQITPELREAAIGHRFGKVFVLSRHSIAVDFRLSDSRYLFISIEPADPRIYLIRRRLRDLEKLAVNPTAFSMALKKRLAGAEATAIEQVPDERIVKIELVGTNELGESYRAVLVSQLTGKSANLFLLDGDGRVVDSLRNALGDGQQIGNIYQPPFRPEAHDGAHAAHAGFDGYDSLSEFLDAADMEKRADAEFRSVANAARAKALGEILKLERLQGKLLGDLESHGDAERWKRLGDLLLANIATAKRKGSKVEVIDYFDVSAPTVGIEVAENESLTGAAERFFKKYTKARNARVEITKRLDATKATIARVRFELAEIDAAVDARDLDALRGRLISSRVPTEKKKKRKERDSPISTVARIFASSEGFEILVGKRAKDNDQLTFRIARSLDTWMHAADYPGSHVVIRNPNRREVPSTTLVEAAQLAAFYSQGKAQPKAAVHYTQKKCVNKPKGAPPGLVSLASFKTILVEPVFPDSVRKQE